MATSRHLRRGWVWSRGSQVITARPTTTKLYAHAVASISLASATMKEAIVHAILPMMRVVVKLFGEFREAVGSDRVELELPSGATCDEALRRLAELEPKLRDLLYDQEGKLRDHLHVFLNGRNVATIGGLGTSLTDGDAISFFPPIGGG